MDRSINAYDFDNTLYRGESIFEFACFFIRKHPSTIKYLSKAVKLYKKYKKNNLTKEEIEETIFSILDSIQVSKKEIDRLVEIFWEKNSKKLNKELLKQIKKEDVILTASPSFLIEKVTLPTKNIYTSDIDIENRKINFLCFGENKKKKWEELHKNKKIKKLYTDSYVDMPLMKIAKEVYLVKKGRGTGKKIKIRKED
jgi:phosphoserine phosphatase